MNFVFLASTKDCPNETSSPAPHPRPSPLRETADGGETDGGRKVGRVWQDGREAEGNERWAKMRKGG